jgi:hypothetical protein
MKAITFKKVDYTSTRTGNVSKKLAVEFDNGITHFLWANGAEFADKDIDETVAIIKADRATYLARTVLTQGQFGIQAQFSNMTVDEEF